MKFFKKLLMTSLVIAGLATPFLISNNNLSKSEIQYTDSEVNEIENYSVTTTTLLYYKELNISSSTATYELFFDPQESGTDFVIEYRINNGQWVTYEPAYDDGDPSREIITFSGLDANKYYEIDFKLNKTIEQAISISFTTKSPESDLKPTSLYYAQPELVTDDTIELYLNFVAPVEDTEYFIEYNIVETSLAGGASAPINDQWVVYVPHENDPSTFSDFEQIVIDSITPGVSLEPSTEYDVYFRINGVVQNESVTVTTDPDTADVQYIDNDGLTDGDPGTTYTSTATSITFEMELNDWDVVPSDGGVGDHLYPTIEYSYKVVYPGGTESTWSPYFISYYGMRYQKYDSKVVENDGLCTGITDDPSTPNNEIEDCKNESLQPDALATNRVVNIGYESSEAQLVPGTTYQIRFRIDGQSQDGFYTYSTKSTPNANPEMIKDDENHYTTVDILDLKTNEITFKIYFTDTGPWAVNDIDSIAYSVNGGKAVPYVTYYECNEQDPNDNDPQCGDASIEGVGTSNSDEDPYSETINIKNLKPDQEYTIRFVVNGVPQKTYFTFSTPIVNNLTPGAATAIIISVVLGIILISMGAYTVYYFKFKDKFK